MVARYGYLVAPVKKSIALIANTISPIARANYKLIQSFMRRSPEGVRKG